MSLYANVICKEDLGAVKGYTGRSLSTIAAFRLMIASKEIRDQTRKSIGDTSQFSKSMEGLFKASQY